LDLSASDKKVLIERLNAAAVDRPAASLFIGAAAFVVYFALLVLTMTLENPFLKTLCSIWLALYVANLMVSGHDAAHNALSRSKTLNRIYGTIALLPCLQPFSIWVRQHNFVHHRYVAQIGLDDTYPPLTPEKYRALSGAGRAYYRFTRSLLGMPLWYLLEITLPVMLFPFLYRRARLTRENLLDIFLVYAWAGFILWLCAGVSAAAHPDKSVVWHWASAAIFGVGLPTFVFTLMMTFLAVFQHTGPDVKWKLPDGAPSGFEDAMNGTVHLILPQWLDFLYLHVMQHQAHHLNVHIDLHEIKAAQSAVAAANGGKLARPWTPSYHLEVVRKCKLYDPDTNSWLTFEEAKARPA